MTNVHYILATAPAPGAIGVVQVHGPGAAALVEKLTGVRPTRRARLANLAGIDEGLIVGLSEEWCELMPHGGMRVVQRLCEKLGELGAVGGEANERAAAREIYPEARSEVEADVLAAMARAASPGAVDPLLDQPGRWAAWAEDDAAVWPIEAQSAARDRLVEPMSVVLVGPANVGKSTLSNLVMGRAASITADLPGTTRDWVAGLAELPATGSGFGPLVVRWFDTPGVRATTDPIERQAIELAAEVVKAADVVVSVSAPGSGWTDARADLRVMNKADLPHDPIAGTVEVSAITGAGLTDLAKAIERVAGLVEVEEEVEGLWAFSPVLKQAVRERDRERVKRYVRQT